MAANAMPDIRADLLEAMQRLHEAHAALVAVDAAKAARHLDTAAAILGEVRTRLSTLSSQFPPKP